MNPERPSTHEAAGARIVELEAEERYARERYQLYKARAYGSRLTSAGRLRELDRRSVLAKRRLDRARAATDYHAKTPSTRPGRNGIPEPPGRTPPTPD
jgi:hypothetical protein